MNYQVYQAQIEHHQAASTQKWRALLKRLWVVTFLTVALCIAGIFFKDFQAIFLVAGFLLLFALGIQPIQQHYAANHAFLTDMNYRLLVELKIREVPAQDYPHES